MALLSITTSLFTGSTAGFAQSVTTPTPEKEEVVKLDTFVVTTDVGKYAEQSTTIGAKMPTLIKDSAFTIQIINANLLNDHLAPTMDDIYPYITGMIRETRDVMGFNVRGFTASSGLQNLVYDGMQGIATKFGSPGNANVERVEVIKGPTSVLYGRLTPGGLINLVTKSPMATRQTSVRTIFSTYSTKVSEFGADVSMSGTLDTTGPIDEAKHWLYRVIVNGEDNHDFRKDNWSHNWVFYPSLTYQPNKNTSFTVKIDAVGQYRRSDDDLTVPPFNNTAFVPSFDVVYQDPADRMGDFAYGISSSLKHLFDSGWQFALSTRSIYHWDDYDGFRSNANAIDVNSVTPVQNSTVTRWYQYKFTTRGFNYFDANAYRDFGKDNFKHTILIGLGGGIERSNVGFYMNASSGPTVSLVNVYNPILGLTPRPANPKDPKNIISASNPVLHSYDMGAYISDHMKVGDNWHVTIGLRYDHQRATFYDGWFPATLAREATKGATVPSGGLLYRLTSSLSLYGNYSESFRPQSVRGQVDGGGQPFLPETGEQFEYGAKFQTADSKLTATLGIYDIKKNNVLEASGGTAPNGLPLGQVIGQQRSQGAELEVIWLPVPNWQITGGYAYVDAKIAKTVNAALLGKPFVNVPHNAFNLWTRYNVPRGQLAGLGFGFGAVNQGKRWGGNVVNQTTAFVMPGYTRFDGAIYYRHGKYDWALNINNLTDKRYLSSTGNSALFPGEPRKLSLNIGRQF